MMTKTWMAAALLPALLLVSAGALGQAADEHDVHHPGEPELAEEAPAGQAGAGMMGRGMMGGGMMGMMGGEAPEGGPGSMMGMMGPGMTGPGMMGHAMMHHPGVVVVPPAVVIVPPTGMTGPGMMRGMMDPQGMGMMGQGMMAPGMPGPEGEEAGPMQPGMTQPGMMGRGMMMQGRGVGPAMLYGVPPAELSVERVQAILEGGLARHGNPRLKLGEVTEQDENTIVAEILTVDDSLVQRLAVDRATGTMRQLP